LRASKGPSRNHQYRTAYRNPPPVELVETLTVRRTPVSLQVPSATPHLVG
jgi:hypothetical protein